MNCGTWPGFACATGGQTCRWASASSPAASAASGPSARGNVTSTALVDWRSNATPILAVPLQQVTSLQYLAVFCLELCCLQLCCQTLTRLWSAAIFCGRGLVFMKNYPTVYRHSAWARPIRCSSARVSHPRALPLDSSPSATSPKGYRPRLCRVGDSHGRYHDSSRCVSLHACAGPIFLSKRRLCLNSIGFGRIDRGGTYSV